MKALHIISAVGLAAAGIVSLVVWSISKPSTQHATVTHTQTAPLDTIMEGVEIKQFDKTGALTHILTVSKWQHRKNAETADWKTPHLKLIQQNGTWDLTAKNGTSLQKKLWGHIDEMHLSQDIVLQHIPHTGVNDWVLKTEYLLLLPDAKIAQTPNTVSIEGPWMFTTAKGLKADLNRETIHFIHTVDSHYHFSDKVG